LARQGRQQWLEERNQLVRSSEFFNLQITKHMVDIFLHTTHYENKVEKSAKAAEKEEHEVGHLRWHRTVAQYWPNRRLHIFITKLTDFNHCAHLEFYQS
jgi:hypothetical protein